jgi:hypothetical protein
MIQPTAQPRDELLTFPRLGKRQHGRTQGIFDLVPCATVRLIERPAQPCRPRSRFPFPQPCQFKPLFEIVGHIFLRQQYRQEQ